MTRHEWLKRISLWAASLWAGVSRDAAPKPTPGEMQWRDGYPPQAPATATMYRQCLGDRVLETRGFVRNGWPVTEVLIDMGGGTVRLVWDPGMPYPIVHSRTVSTPFDGVLGPIATTRAVGFLRTQVETVFDTAFRPGRVYAGPAFPGVPG
jgi:hypothetical protein